MTLRIINSKKIKFVEYENKDECIRIYHQNGKVYESPNMTRELFEEMICSNSIDDFYFKKIKNKYPTYEIKPKKSRLI